jgi:hypothetical protein
LQIVLDKLKDNQDTIKTIYGNSDSTPNLMKTIGNAFNNLTGSDKIEDEKKAKEPMVVVTKIEPQFYSEISEVRKLLKSIKNSLDKPAPASSFHR